MLLDLERERPILNREELNHSGEAYAMVVAETAYQAQDAVEAVFSELDPLPGVAGVMNAIAPNAPLVHADMTSNSRAKRALANHTGAVTFSTPRGAAEDRPTAASASSRLSSISRHCSK